MQNLMAMAYSSIKQVITLLVVGAILWTSGGLAHGTQPNQGQAAPPSGLIVIQQTPDGRATLIVRSTQRFELILDDQGIASWYDLRRDPQRRANLVAAGTHLLEHRVAGSTAPLTGQLTLVRATPVQTQIVWRGTTSASLEPFTITYTIWVGGQIAITTRSAGPLLTDLHRDPLATVGAVLQTVSSETIDGGLTQRTLMLYLDAWMGEELGIPVQAITNRLSGAVRTSAMANQPVRIEMPLGTLRQPRLEIAHWPGANFTIRRAGKILVAGQDYLADWDTTSGLLVVQYLGLLTPDASAQERTFEIIDQFAPTTLSLGVSGRTLDEATGLLVIDANVPAGSSPLSNTTNDIFKIPYIQSTPQVIVTGTTQGAPAGSGVQFVLDGTIVATVFGSSVQTTITLPRMQEYRLDGYIVTSNGQRLNNTADDSIETLGYGRIFVAIGDSITAGLRGYGVGPNNNKIGPITYSYPVTSYVNSPEGSTDRRNIYQLDNYFVSGSSLPEYDSYNRGYQMRLNNLLATCGGTPMFILNDGVSDNRTAYFANSGESPDPNSVLARAPAYNSHIATLGADRVLLQIGTNDASGIPAPDPSLLPIEYNHGLTNAIAALQTPNSGLKIWVARIPWRGDSGSNAAALTRTQDFNAEIPNVITARNSGTNPVRLGPDFYSHFLNNPSYLDATDASNLHPNQTGYDSMADLWATTLCSDLPPPPAVTPTSTATATATATPTRTTGSIRIVNLPLIVR